MKARARIVVPILAALLIVAGVLAILWWQITQSQESLRAELRRGTPTEELPFGEEDTALPEPIDTGDRVLLHLRQGDLFALQGEWAKAEGEYQAAVDGNGGLPALRKLAQAQLQRRNVEGAKDTIDQLKAAGARTEDLLLLEVIVALRTGEVVQARTRLSEAPDSPQKHYGLALVAIIQGDHDTAKQELGLVIGGWDPALRAYARTLQEAYEEFALFPESRPLHLQTLLGRALAQVQECELALPMLSQVLEEESDYRDAWMVQGYCELTTERAAQALASFERAYELDPEKPEIAYFLGRAAAELKDWKKAATFYGYALQNGFAPEKEVRTKLADAALALGDSALALEQLQTLAKLPDADIESTEKLVTLLITEKKHDEAYAAAKSAVSHWSQNARSYDLLAWAAMELGSNDEAKTLLEQALKLDPGLQSARERYSKL